MELKRNLAKMSKWLEMGSNTNKTHTSEWKKNHFFLSFILGIFLWIQILAKQSCVWLRFCRDPFKAYPIQFTILGSFRVGLRQTHYLFAAIKIVSPF